MLRNSHKLIIALAFAALPVMLILRSAMADWSSDSTVNGPICTATSDQIVPQLIGSNGAIYTWQDSRNGSPNIYAQRTNLSGTVQWAANGVAVSTAAGGQYAPQIITDTSAGAIICWEDHRNGNADIYAQRINWAGVAQWTAGGVPICTATGDQNGPRMVPDGVGGAIITWTDYRTAKANIYAQRINGAGAVQWAANGVGVNTSSGNQTDPQIAIDGSGGAIISWEDNRSRNLNIYTQRLNSAGVKLWYASGKKVTTASGSQTNCRITYDGASGAICVWQDLRSGANWQIYAQRNNLTGGSAQWGSGGKAVCTAAGDHKNPSLVNDGSGGAFFTWEDYRNGDGSQSDIYAQLVNNSGVSQWAANGVPICLAANNQTNPQIVSDGAGGVEITWEDARSANFDIYAQRVNATGVAQWTANGAPVCTAVHDQNAPELVTDGSNGSIIVWADKRNNVDSDIYAQRIKAAGALDGPLPAPTVTSITPSTGVNTGPVNITNLAGTHLDSGGLTVKLKQAGQPDIVATSVVVVSANQATCTFDLTGASTGSWDVAVTTAGGSATLGAGFTVLLPAPTVTAITPSSGVNTGTVNITNLAGTHFDTGGLTVKLKQAGQPDIVATSVVVASANQITCTFNLTGAATGSWDVVVATSGGSAVLGAGFTVTVAGSPAPTVTAITPSSGVNTGTVNITNLAGTNLNTGSLTVSLKKAGQPIIAATSVVAVSATQATCTFNLTGAATGAWDVSVSTVGGSATLASGFSVLLPAPTVTAITPSTGVNTGSVNISNLAGTHLDTGSLTVTLKKAGQADIPGTAVVVVSATQAKCTFDLTGVATGAWDVVAATSSGTATLAGGFTVTATAPSVTSITPSTGVNTGTVNITNLAGLNFNGGGATVSLKKTGQADVAGTSVVVVSGTQITCTFDLTGKATGSWDVVVTTAGGSSTLAAGFSVTAAPAPTVTAITPSTGVNTGPINITNLAGTHLDTGGLTVVLSQAGQPYIVGTSDVVVSANQITCTFDLTGAATGAWDVAVVTTWGTGILSGGFTVTAVGAAAPTVSGITANSDTSVDIAGTHFDVGSLSIALRMAGQPDITGTVLTATSTDIHGIFDTTGAAPGTWDVVVTTAGGTATLPAAYTVTLPAPTVTAITPSTGVNTGPINITNLAGTNFDTGGLVVKLKKTGQADIVATSDLAVSAGQITCTFNLTGAAAGTWDVAVTTNGGTATLSGGFTVTAVGAAAPTVTAITPSTGVNTGTVNITNLVGTHLDTGGLTVTLKKTGQANIAGTAVVVVSATQATCTFNLTGAVTGAWDVAVTTNGGTATLSGGFSVTAVGAAAPTVTSISPLSGANTGPISITNLAGTNLDAGGLTVVLRQAGQPDIAATGVVVVSPTQATCTLDLTGAATGAWNVVVTTSGGSTTFAGGFTINPPAPTVGTVTVNLDTSADITGTHFDGGGLVVTLKKTGQPDIVGTAVVTGGGTGIHSTFDLSGAVSGLWDLWVTTNGGTVIRVGAYNVLAGGGGGGGGVGLGGSAPGYGHIGWSGCFLSTATRRR